MVGRAGAGERLELEAGCEVGLRTVFSLPASWLMFSSHKPKELPARLHRALDGAPEPL